MCWCKYCTVNSSQFTHGELSPEDGLMDDSAVVPTDVVLGFASVTDRFKWLSLISHSCLSYHERTRKMCRSFRSLLNPLAAS